QADRKPDVVVVNGLVTAVDGDLVTKTDDVVDFKILLMVIGNEAGSVSRIQFSRPVSGKLPLVDRCVETVTAVEHVGMRHVADIFLAEPHRVHAGAVRIPWTSLLDDCIRAIRFCWRIGQGAKNAEVPKLPAI